MRFSLSILLVISIGFNFAQFSTKEQAFLAGIHDALGIEPNKRIFGFINSQNFNITSIEEGLQILGTGLPQSVEKGVNQVRSVFLDLSRDIFDELARDVNFGILMNYTLTDFWDQKAFDSKVKIYKRRTGRNALREMKKACTQLKREEYKSSGWSFGNLIFNLRKVALREEQLINGATTN
jgi:hypothetical protein